MTRRGGERTVFRVIAAGLALAALVLAWWMFAPPQLGGRTTYLTVVGGSMEPGLSSGDLVLVRPATSYGVGDVVAYRSQELDAVVLHRIVAVQGDAFVMRGDANSWTDADRPTEENVVGALALRAPWLGATLTRMRSPAGLAVVTGIVAGVLVLGAARRRRRHPTTGETQRRRPLDEGRRPRIHARAVIAVRTLGILAVGLGILAALAFARPTTARVARALTYQQAGDFAYAANAPDGNAVYGKDGVTTGEPVYLRLADRLDVTFDYRLETASAPEVSGSIVLVAIASDEDGWVREFALAPASSFEGTEASTDGVLDLREVTAVIGELQRLSGVERLGYSVKIVARVRAHGRIGGRTTELAFEPELPFVLDEHELQLAPTDQSVEALIHPVAGGLVQVQEQDRNDLVLLGVRLTPLELRVSAVATLAIVLIGLLTAAMVTMRSRTRAEHERIEATYGRRLVSVGSGASSLLAQAVDVDSMETLALLSAHYDQVILHEEHLDAHIYFFRDGGIAYRYRSPSEASLATSDLPTER